MKFTPAARNDKCYPLIYCIVILWLKVVGMKNVTVSNSLKEKKMLSSTI